MGARVTLRDASVVRAAVKKAAGNVPVAALNRLATLAWTAAVVRLAFTDAAYATVAPMTAVAVLLTAGGGGA